MSIKRLLSVMLVLLGVALGGNNLGYAQEEPLVPAKPSLNSVILSLDSRARLREDSLVTFSDGTQYVLISPVTPSEPDRLEILTRIPEQKQPADMILFNDGHYLLRILTLPTGQKTFPVLPEIPDEMKTGLLAQNLTFPEGFFLPTPWKALTGNLLVNPDESLSKVPPPAPLVMAALNPNRLIVWNTATAQSDREIPLDCPPSVVEVSEDGKMLWVGCQQQNKLYAYALQDASVTPVVLELSKPVGSLALDTAHHRLYIGHPGGHTLSIVDTQAKAVKKSLWLPYATGTLVVSPTRAKLFVSVPTSQKFNKEEEEMVYTGLSRFFRHPPRVEALKKEQAALENAVKPGLQIINTTTQALERVSPTLEGVTMLYNQDEKLLWMYSPEAKSLQAFDMRWQEFSQVVALEEPPADFASDDTWLYLLLPKQNVLARLNAKTMMWGAPITLEPGATPQSLVYMPEEHQALVLSQNPNGLQVINLNRGEWVGTQQTAFEGIGQMIPLGTSKITPSEQVRIKFQDGRVLRQTVHGLQWDKLLSDPHGPQNSQTPPAPAETTSTP